MKKLGFIIASCLLLAAPCILRADNEAHEIELTEVGLSSSDWNDDGTTRDGDGGTSITPTTPTQFHAIINGHLLSVGCHEPRTTVLQVFTADGTQIIYHTFTRATRIHITDAGYYTLTLNNGWHSFSGSFEIIE